MAYGIDVTQIQPVRLPTAVIGEAGASLIVPDVGRINPSIESQDFRSQTVAVIEERDPNNLPMAKLQANQVASEPLIIEAGEGPAVEPAATLQND